MTKFEREQMSQLNRAMDRYRDALKRVIDAIVMHDESADDLLYEGEALLAINAARELLK